MSPPAARRERELFFPGQAARIDRPATGPACRVRQATAADAEAVAGVYLRSRRTHLPFAPLAHADADVRRWIETVVLPAGGTRVAEHDGRVAALLTLSRDAGGTHWIEHLYVDPPQVGGGIGAALMAVALRVSGRPLRLYTFAANAGARRFYERHGFRQIAFGDGSGNEEGQPDVLYELA